MAMIRDERDIPALLDILRHEVAQNRTDIQRLWRLLARETHEPFFVIGGDAVDSSASDGVDDPGPAPLPDNTNTPGGGPSPTGIQEGCCLWIWDGSQWRLAVDRAVECGCPTPEVTGSFVNQTTTTCCESSDASDADPIPCDGCAIPRTIHVTTSRLAGPAEPTLEALIGTTTLAWSGTNWISDCRPVIGGGLYTGVKAIAVCTSGSCKLLLAVPRFSGDDCAGIIDSVPTACLSFTCDPLLQVNEVTLIGSTYRFIITE